MTTTDDDLTVTDVPSDASGFTKVCNEVGHDQLRRWSQTFRRRGIVTVTDLLPLELRDTMRAEAVSLLDRFAERRDLRLATTDYTRRSMSVVTSETIGPNSAVLRDLYGNGDLRANLESIARESLHDCPKLDEEFLISRHEKAGDTHGWHWGDFSFALIWVLVAPPIDAGGLLQCVPHTDWNKAEPNIYRYLVENQIDTYVFESGDVYFLRTDTTLHRTLPLREDVTRIMLNMTYAGERDLGANLVGDDRWWSDTDASDAAVIEPYL